MKHGRYLRDFLWLQLEDYNPKPHHVQDQHRRLVQSTKGQHDIRAAIVGGTPTCKPKVHKNDEPTVTDRTAATA